MKRYYWMLIFFCFVLPLAGQAQTNYYVSTSGNDSFAGTTAQAPWRHIQKAATTAIPGSTVNIMAGTYDEAVTISVSGTSSNPITFKNYQNGIVTLSGATLSGAAPVNLLTITSKSNLVIDGLVLANLTTPFANGVQVTSNPGAGVQNVTLRNLKIHDIRLANNTGAHGIEVYGRGTAASDAISNLTIEGCEVYNNINGFNENIVLNGNVDGFSILNNMVHDNSNIGIGVAGNYGASATAAFDHVRNGIVAGNTTWNNLSGGTNAGIYYDGCQSTIIERNIAHHNPVGISIGCERNGSTDNVTVRDNVLYQNSFTGIAFGGYTTATTGVVQNSSISNNTCYANGSSQAGQLRLTKVVGCSIFNNLFFSDDNILFYVENITPQSFTSEYNAFYTTTGNSATASVTYRGAAVNFGAYRTVTGQEPNSFFVNPLLVNTSSTALNLHLQSASPLVNAGKLTYIPSSTERDIDGQNRANGRVDIGADEYYVALAVGSAKPLAQFEAYPNPTTQELVVTLAQAYSRAHLQVYTSMGRLFAELPVENATHIPVSAWPAGLYLLRLKERPQEALKLLKQ